MSLRASIAALGAAIMIGVAALAHAATEQKPFSECVPDPEPYMAMDFANFDQGVAPAENSGERVVWGWREIAQTPGCEDAIAELISAWRVRHDGELDDHDRSFIALHEGQMRAAAGDYERAIPLVEAGRVAFSDPVEQAYLDAIVAFLNHDRAALLAARDRMLAIPPPENWSELQRAFREQASQEMQWPLNIEATNKLVACFGEHYPVSRETTCSAGLAAR